MRKTILLLFMVAGAAFLFLGSCVSSPKMATDKAQQQYDQLSQDYTNLQKRDNDLVENVQNLKKAIDDKDAQINSLNKQIDDLKKSNADLSSTLTGKSDLTAKIASLTKERDDLSTRLFQAQSKLNDADLATMREDKAMADLESALKKELADLIANNNAQVFVYKGTLVVDINEVVLFDPDSATLKPGFNDMLIRLSTIFKKAPEKIVRVEGHTADSPNSIWPSSWELGAMRAVSVVRFFQNQGGFDPTHIVAVTSGRFRPIAPNDTEANMKKNRRVEIVLIDREFYEIKDLQSVSQP